MLKNTAKNPFNFEEIVDYHSPMLSKIIVPIAANYLVYTFYYKNRILPYFNLLFATLYLIPWTFVLFSSV